MAFDDGYKAVTTAGTRVALSTDTSIVGEVTVQAAYENTSLITVGDVGVVAAAGATHRGIDILAGDSVTYRHVALSDLYIDSRVSGEAVTFTYGS